LARKAKEAQDLNGRVEENACKAANEAASAPASTRPASTTRTPEPRPAATSWAKQFGGSGENPRNFVPQSDNATSQVMTQVEDKIAGDIRNLPAGATVDYGVVPIYPNGSDPVPTAVLLVAIGGGMNVKCRVTNDASASHQIPEDGVTCG
jgi:hypothetical protein